MPNVKTHDTITVCTAPVSTFAGAVFSVQTQSLVPVLIAPLAHLFAGYMFGPDLDMYHSRPTQRWGWLAFIWWPYSRLIKHRSFWSHGPLVGTTVRLLYLLTVCVVSLGPVTWWAYQFLKVNYNISPIPRLLINTSYFFVVLVALELGAASHYLADWFGSYRKRQARYAPSKKNR